MISIDIGQIDNEFIDWKSVIAKSLLGEKVSVKKAGKEVLQIIPTQPTLAENHYASERRQFGLLKGKITVPNDSRWGDEEIQAMFDPVT